MKTYTISELFNLTRYQFFALHDGIQAEISRLPDDHPDRPAGFAKLRLIRCVLSRASLIL
jgi:hypothetical protein